MNRAPSPGAAPDAARKRPHGSFLDDAIVDGHEHGERADAAPREDSLIDATGSHSPATDTRAEEPCGEIAPNVDTEGGVD